MTGGFAILGKLTGGTAIKNERGGTYGKIILGTFVLGAVLSTFQGNAERLAAMLAWVAALTSMLINGQAVFGAVSKVTK